jgi:ABC-2 type transport system permease protein
VSRLRSTWLVARREILERGRSRGYILSLVFTLLLLGLSFALPVLLIGEQDEIEIGIVAGAPAELEAVMSAVAEPYDLTVQPTRYPDRAAGEAALTDKDIDGLVEVPADLSSPGELVVRDRVDERIRVVVSTSVATLRQQQLLGEAGVSAADFAAASQLPAVTPLDPQSAEDDSLLLFANAGIILMFIAIFSYGTWVLTAVVEEKQSRVVEVVLSTVRPRDLLTGKVLGIGTLALGQLLVLVAVGIAAARLTGSVTLPATIPVTVALFLMWFILGFLLYATTLGFLGSLATRMEEASNATTPVTMVAIVCYFATIFVAQQDPGGSVATVLTFLPPAAPFVVPLRIALDAISLPEVVLSLALTVAFVFLLFVLGGRVYSGAVLQTGGRMKLRDAWRLAR